MFGYFVPCSVVEMTDLVFILDNRWINSFLFTFLCNNILYRFKIFPSLKKNKINTSFNKRLRKTEIIKVIKIF